MVLWHAACNSFRKEFKVLLWFYQAVVNKPQTSYYSVTVTAFALARIKVLSSLKQAIVLQCFLPNCVLELVGWLRKMRVDYYELFYQIAV